MDDKNKQLREYLLYLQSTKEELSNLKKKKDLDFDKTVEIIQLLDKNDAILLDDESAKKITEISQSSKNNNQKATELISLAEEIIDKTYSTAIETIQNSDEFDEELKNEFCGEKEEKKEEKKDIDNLLGILKNVKENLENMISDLNKHINALETNLNQLETFAEEKNLKNKKEVQKEQEKKNEVENAGVKNEKQVEHDKEEIVDLENNKVEENEVENAGVKNEKQVEHDKEKAVPNNVSIEDLGQNVEDFFGGDDIEEEIDNQNENNVTYSL